MEMIPMYRSARSRDFSLGLATRLTSATKPIHLKEIHNGFASAPESRKLITINNPPYITTEMSRLAK